MPVMIYFNLNIESYQLRRQITLAGKILCNIDV
jgi:hypothetical protein